MAEKGKAMAHAQDTTSEPFSFRGNQALLTGLTTWAASSSEYQRELMNFIQIRLEKDRAALQTAISSKNPLETAGTQMRWAAEMLTDYNQELLKMAAIYSNLGPLGARKAEAERQS
jgi:hypothetical protein